MGIVYSIVIKKVRRFNVDNRAERAIERKNPVTAPRHPSSQKYYDEVIEGTPEARRKLDEKDPKLENYLKNVYVTSNDMVPELVKDRSNYPQNRKPVVDEEFGFWQPTEVPEGQANLSQILTIITHHQKDAKLWSTTALAKEYKLNERQISLILQYYKTFNLYLPTFDDKAKNSRKWRNILGDPRSMLQLGDDEKTDKKS